MTKKIQFKDIIEAKKEEQKKERLEDFKKWNNSVQEQCKEREMTPPEEQEHFSRIPIPKDFDTSSFKEHETKFSKDKIQKGYTKLEELIQRREEHEKILNELITRNDSLLNKFFKMVNATEEEQKECLDYLTKEEESKLKGILDDELLKQSDEVINERISNAIEKDSKEAQEEHSFKYKNFNPLKVKTTDFTKLLDEQFSLFKDNIEELQKAQDTFHELIILQEKFSIFTYNKQENIILKNESASKEAIDLFFKINEEAEKFNDIYQGLLILSQKKGIGKIFPEGLFKQEEEEIQELKMTLKEKENLQKIKFDRNKNLQLDSQVRFNDKISNHLTLLEKGEKATFNNIFGKTGKFKNEQVDVSTSETIDDFEREVLFLCYSVLKKNNSFTIRQIREKMTGRENRNETDLDKEIAKAIEKLRKTDFKIALSDELIKEKYFEIKEEFPSGLGGYILPLDFEEKTTSVNKYGVNIDTYYFIKGQSPFFFYAERTGMIQTFGDKLIKCEGKKKINFNSKERIVARQVLLSKIKTLQSLLFRKEELQKQKKWSQKQEQQFKNLQNIYLKDFKLPEIHEQSKRRNIEFIENMLSNYQELKEIKSFQFITKENKFIIIPLIVNYKDIKMIGYEEQEEE